MLLVLLDHEGPVLFVGAEPIATTEAGLVLAAQLAAGREPDPAELAATHGVDRQGLEDLAARLRTWFASVPADRPIPLDRGVAYVAPEPAAYSPDVLLQAPLPLPAMLTDRGYVVWVPSSADPLVLDPHEAALLCTFALPRRGATVTPDRLPGNPLVADAAVRDAFLTRMAGVGLLGEHFSFPARKSGMLGENGAGPMRDGSRHRIKRQNEILAARPPRAGRVPVFGIEAAPKAMPPLGIGLLFSAALAHDGGKLGEIYDLVPDWNIRPKAIKRLVADGPGVFLFSDYIWSLEANLVISATVKAASPHSVVIHGGPDAPKYDGDREQFFSDHPAVDVIVHGEGEATLPELLAALDGQLDGDLRALAGVAGITYRPTPGAEPISTADRPRLDDLNVVPSPYLTGIFDAWDGGAATMAVLETNRGCPYGCTFCDWGSATLSRIRKYDLDRVFGEVEWMAKAKVEVVLVADANFGIFERDVAIAEKVVEARATYGYPRAMFTNYAKNTVKHLEPIVSTLIAGGLHGHGIMSVQTFDEPTLQITRRKNLKTQDYARLGAQFVEAQLPIFSDLMLGLPGATLASTLSDMQRLIDQEITARTYPTQLLTNSPMNEPSYRVEWQIETDERGMLRSTKSYTAAERAEMDRAIIAFHAADTYGILRVVLRWLTDQTGVREIDVLDRLRHEVESRPEQAPLVAWVLGRFPSDTIPPGTWPLLFDQIERLLVACWDIDVEGTEWQAVRMLQEHVLPDRGRAFPDVVELPHDVVAWLHDVREHPQDRTGRPSLGSFGPSTLVVSDPMGTCAQLGIWRSIDDTHSAELGWPMARNMTGRWDPVS